MSKAVLISIKPKWCEKIVSGEKTVEIRKTAPKLETPFKCYIYYTKERPTAVYGLSGKVVCEFVCDRIDTILPCYDYYSYFYDIYDDTLSETCLTMEELYEYGNGKDLYGWHISDLKIYDEPKELSEFRTPNAYHTLKQPPQSWCYVEELKE